jgi:hypothetical protein
MAAESVIYLRGPLPTPLGDLVTPKFLADAKHVLSLPIERVEAIAESLSSFPGFLDPKSLRERIGSIISSEAEANATSRLIFILSEMFRSSGRTLEDLSAQLDASQKADENQRVLSVEELAALEHRLRLIVRPFDGIERYVKARRLVNATGLKLKEIELICDLRPVFDSERTRVEGIFPYTILKVVCDGVDGLPLSLEAILTEHDVVELAKKAGAATTKLKSLKELLVAKDIPNPAVGMTGKEGD